MDTAVADSSILHGEQALATAIEKIVALQKAANSLGLAALEHGRRLQTHGLPVPESWHEEHRRWQSERADCLTEVQRASAVVDSSDPPTPDASLDDWVAFAEEQRQRGQQLRDNRRRLRILDQLDLLRGVTPASAQQVETLKQAIDRWRTALNANDESHIATLAPPFGALEDVLLLARDAADLTLDDEESELAFERICEAWNRTLAVAILRRRIGWDELPPQQAPASDELRSDEIAPAATVEPTTDSVDSTLQLPIQSAESAAPEVPEPRSADASPPAASPSAEMSDDAQAASAAIAVATVASSAASTGLAAAVVPAGTAAESVLELAGRLTFNAAPPSSAQPAVRPPQAGHDVPDSDLPYIEQRARLKGQASHWAIERLRHHNQKTLSRNEILQRDEALQEQARRIPGCGLWMNHEKFRVPEDGNLLDQLGVCFDTLANALAAIQFLRGNKETTGPRFEAALSWLAEAQSATRVATQRVMPGGKGADLDQSHAFHWLRRTISEGSFAFVNHLSLDDPASPDRAANLNSTIRSELAAWEDQLRRDVEAKRLFKRSEHLLNSVRGEPENAARHWTDYLKTLDDLIELGVRPSDARLRALLLPIKDSLSDAMFETAQSRASFRQVWRQLDQYLATRPAEDKERDSQLSPRVAEVANLLAGRTLVLIGGDRRSHSEQALKSAFRLDAIEWISSAEHTSIERFRAPIQRPEVAVVLLAIRWSSHSYGEVKSFCDDVGKPLVRLPAGYSPNQVAAQIYEQCGRRLKEQLPQRV